MCQCHSSAPDAALAAFTLILNRLEHMMTTQAEAFDALSAKVDDIAADFTALVAALAAERENLTESGQAALATAEAKVAALDAVVGDADGSDTPPADPPADPE